MNIDLDKILETGAQLADSAKKTATDLAQKGKEARISIAWYENGLQGPKIGEKGLKWRFI